MSETVKPLSQIVDHMVNEKGKIIDFDVALYPALGGNPAFVIVEAEPRMGDSIAFHVWTRDEAQRLYELLGLVLSPTVIEETEKLHEWRDIR